MRSGSGLMGFFTENIWEIFKLRSARLAGMPAKKMAAKAAHLQEAVSILS